MEDPANELSSKYCTPKYSFFNSTFLKYSHTYTPFILIVHINTCLMFHKYTVRLCIEALPCFIVTFSLNFVK